MKKILFCGGGSAGHVTPNVALINDLKDKYETCYAGTEGIEKNICKKNGIPFYQFETVKLVRGKILCNLKIPFKLFKSVKYVKNLLKKIKPDLVFCKGGYVCVPVAVAAHKLNIPVITHESDVIPGLANRIISRYCQTVLTAFPSTANYFKKGVYVGTPMRKSLFNRNKVEAREFFGLDMRPCVLVFGGGSGSKIINDSLKKIAPEICKHFNLLHICGKGNADGTEIYGYKQVEFCDDMGLALACADVAVARCGANSAAELTALKIPALYVPLENKRSRGDQIKNAKYFSALGTCKILREKELSAQSLKKSIFELIEDRKIKDSLNKINYKSGNEKIIREIGRVINK